MNWLTARSSPALERTLTGDGLWVSAVALTPDGRRAIAAWQVGPLEVWDLTTGALERTLTVQGNAQ